MEKITFHVITPFFGPKEFLDNCIKSVKGQVNVEVKHHVIIDDARKGACRNHFEALQTIQPVSSNIIVHLDGDDFLLNDRCLEVVKKVYRDENVWATYGSYISNQGCICKPSIDSIPFRDEFKYFGWKWSHLRTFRANLIPHLKEEDMKDLAGNWYSSAPDVAVFLPVLEMCGKSRVKYITDPLVYYRIHPGNEHSTEDKLMDQVRCALHIMSRSKYSVIV